MVYTLEATGKRFVGNCGHGGDWQGREPGTKGPGDAKDHRRLLEMERKLEGLHTAFGGLEGGHGVWCLNRGGWGGVVIVREGRSSVVQADSYYCQSI